MSPALAVALSCTLLVAPRTRATGTEDAEPLTLLWVDAGEQASFAYSRMAASAALALADLGIDVRWQRVAPGAELPAGLLVVLLPRSLDGRRDHVMGVAARQAPVSAVYVFLDRVAEALGFDTALQSWSLPRRLRLAHALGRVVAHEVVHALRPGLPHGPTGLFAARFTLRELLEPAPAWDASTRAALAR